MKKRLSYRTYSWRHPTPNVCGPEFDFPLQGRKIQSYRIVFLWPRCFRFIFGGFKNMPHWKFCLQCFLTKTSKILCIFCTCKKPQIFPYSCCSYPCIFFALPFLSAEAGVRRCSTKLVILKISQNLQENICAGVIF